jgi:putative ABC transport system substrate-binding protein
MSYGTDIQDGWRLTGVHTGRILGDKPANLAVQQSTKVELVIDMNTAKALDLAIPRAAVRSS